MLRDSNRIQAALAAAGLKALVATAAENIRYLTDYETPALFIYRYPGAFAVASPGRDPVLILPISGLEYIIERPVATGQIITTGTYHVGRRAGASLSPAEEQLQALRAACPHFANAAEAIAATLDGVGADTGSVGLDEQGITPATWRSLSQRMPRVALIEAASTFAEIRKVKTAAEIALLREAARINERAAACAFALGREGVSEAALEEVFWTEVARARAVPGHWETTIGARSSGSFHAGASRARAGDLIRSDSSCRFRGYWSDTGRTRVIGTASAEHLRTYEAIRAGQEAALRAVRPGVQAGDLFTLCVETIRRDGVPQYRRHHVGHGIGLDMYEPPLLTENSEERLEAGMTINIETPHYESGYGGFQVEDTILVTATGCEILTAADRGLARAGGNFE